MKRVVKVIGYILLSSITIFSYSEVLATSGKLRSSSIITCDGIMYGQHGDGHWHKAVHHKSGYYPSGSPVTPPCLTSNNSSSSKKNNANSNSSTNTKEKESVNLKIESILINNESINNIKDIMDYTTYGENINLEEFPEEVLEFIASKFNSNVRTLEGALKRLIFYATINNSDFTIELANEALRDLFKAEQKNSKVDVNNIIKEVGAYYDVSVADILSKKRKKNIAYARQVAMFLTRELTGSSFPKIGEAFSGRDHTTIMHGCEKIEKELKESDELKKAISDLKQVLS